MSQHVTSTRYQLVTSAPEKTGSFAEDVAAGLTGASKHLPCHWFYDDSGSELFEEICELPELLTLNVLKRLSEPKL